MTCCKVDRLSDVEALAAGLCPACQKNEADTEIHACPYQADINDDPEPCCYCCSDCSNECAMDI